MKNKKKIKKLNSEMQENAITLKKFLMIYYGIYNTTALNSKLSHKEIKALIPQLRRVSFDELLKNKNDMYVGNTVLVIDSYGNIAPYICPRVSELKEFQEYDCECIDSRRMEDLIISEDLSVYQLSLLCKEYKRLNRMHEYWIVKKLLKGKKDIKVKKYKKEKFNLESKGREEDD